MTTIINYEHKFAKHIIVYINKRHIENEEITSMMFLDNGDIWVNVYSGDGALLNNLHGDRVSVWPEIESYRRFGEDASLSKGGFDIQVFPSEDCPPSIFYELEKFLEPYKVK